MFGQIFLGDQLMIKEFVELMQNAIDIHKKKSEDYANVNVNEFENFERAAMIVSWFNSDIDKVFATMIGIKLARLATLLNKDGDPNNESIDDSFLDNTVYSGLWTSYHRRYPKKGNPSLSELQLFYTDQHSTQPLPNCWNSLTRQLRPEHEYLNGVCTQCGWAPNNPISNSTSNSGS